MYFLNLFKKGEKLYVHFGVSSPLSWLWLFSECQFVKMIMWWHETVFNHKIWFKTIYSDELSSKTDLGVFFSTPKAIGRWHCVTGHKSDIPAEVMSALCIMCCRCTLWRHMDTWSQLFQATHPFSHPKDLLWVLRCTWTCTYIVHHSANKCNICLSQATETYVKSWTNSLRVTQ